MSEMYNSNPQTGENNSSQPFDKAEWARQKKAEREHAFDTMNQMSELVAQGPNWLKLYLDVQSRFPRIKVGNALLIAAQKPNAVELADFDTWKKRGVNIRQGESGIVILERGNEYTRADGSQGVSYTSQKVFDISQTTAKTVPEPEVHHDDRLLLRALVFHAPCEVQSTDVSRIPAGSCAFYDKPNRTIFVARNQETKELFPAIAKELAHALMDGPDYSRDACDFKAACVAYILCKRNSIEMTDDAVPAIPEDLTGLDAKGIRGVLSDIREIANKITKDMERINEVRKDERPRDDAR